MKLSEIDFSKIKIPLVIDLIKTQMANGVVNFMDLKSTAPDENDIANFNTVEDSYLVNNSLEKVFNHYLTANPSKAWSGGKLVGFGFGLDKNTDEVFYPGADYPGAKEGQVLYIYMSFWGLKKIAVAQELIKIDPENHTIIFSYVEGGMTSGMQVMQFSSSTENRTKIVHTSYFKGVSAFRDKYLYPYFHSKVVGKFHENLRLALK